MFKGGWTTTTPWALIRNSLLVRAFLGFRVQSEALPFECEAPEELVVVLQRQAPGSVVEKQRVLSAIAAMKSSPARQRSQLAVHVLGGPSPSSASCTAMYHADGTSLQTEKLSGELISGYTEQTLVF